MTALNPQQRIQLLADPNSFEPFGTNVRSRFPYDIIQEGDGAVCGFAKISNRDVVIVIQDAACMNGTMGEAHSKKIIDAVRFAIKTKVPFIALFNSGGARIQEGIEALNPTAAVAATLAKASGMIPTIAVLTGPNSGATAYISALMDFTIMVEGASMFLTGPKVIEKVTGQKTGMQELGGTAVHSARTGLAAQVSASEKDAFDFVKKILHYLPQHYLETERNFMDENMMKSVSASAMDVSGSYGYDMKEVIAKIVDTDSFLELQSAYAENLITGFAALCGLKIGIIANQPIVMSGVIDAASSKKMFRFLQTCDAYNIPLLFLTDTPGFMPGKQEEHDNIIGAGAKLLQVLASSTIPKINIVTGKWIGGAYAGMCSKAMGADHVYVWDRAQMGVLGVEPALGLIYANRIREKNNDPEFIEQLRKEYSDKVLSPFVGAQTGLIDGIIHREETRPLLAKLFYSLQYKTEKPPQRKRAILPM